VTLVASQGTLHLLCLFTCVTYKNRSIYSSGTWENKTQEAGSAAKGMLPSYPFSYFVVSSVVTASVRKQDKPN